MFARDKRSSLFNLIPSDNKNSFSILATSMNVKKLFFFITDDEAK